MIKGLPEKLRELRERHGYSQKLAAHKLKVSPSIMSGYENGTRTPSTDMIVALAYLYHCSTDYLLGKEETGAAITIDAEGLSNRQIRAIYELVDSMKSK